MVLFGIFERDTGEESWQNTGMTVGVSYFYKTKWKNIIYESYDTIISFLYTQYNKREEQKFVLKNVSSYKINSNNRKFVALFL